MTTRSETYQQFATRFHAGKRLRPATAAQLDEAEAALGLLLPESYRQFATTCGGVYTPDLLDLILAKKPGFADVQQFLTTKQMVTETRRARLSPTGTRVMFAYDCSANWFELRDLSPIAPRPDEAAVWFIDLESETEEKQADSFEEWIGRFLGL